MSENQVGAAPSERESLAAELEALAVRWDGAADRGTVRHSSITRRDCARELRRTLRAATALREPAQPEQTREPNECDECLPYGRCPKCGEVGGEQTRDEKLEELASRAHGALHTSRPGNPCGCFQCQALRLIEHDLREYIAAAASSLHDYGEARDYGDRMRAERDAAIASLRSAEQTPDAAWREKGRALVDALEVVRADISEGAEFDAQWETIQGALNEFAHVLSAGVQTPRVPEERYCKPNGACVLPFGHAAECIRGGELREFVALQWQRVASRQPPHAWTNRNQLAALRDDSAIVFPDARDGCDIPVYFAAPLQDGAQPMEETP